MKRRWKESIHAENGRQCVMLGLPQKLYSLQDWMTDWMYYSWLTNSSAESKEGMKKIAAYATARFAFVAGFSFAIFHSLRSPLKQKGIRKRRPKEDKGKRIMPSSQETWFRPTKEVMSRWKWRHLHLSYRQPDLPYDCHNFLFFRKRYWGVIVMQIFCVSFTS